MCVYEVAIECGYRLGQLYESVEKKDRTYRLIENYEYLVQKYGGFALMFPKMSGL